MTERLVKHWFCDRCDRSVKRGVMPPSGWHEAADRYGNVVHSCPDFECEHWLRRFCEQNGLELPWKLRPEAAPTPET